MDINFLKYGLFNLPWWGYVVITLLLTHITICSVTIYLHRYSAHRALDLNPSVSHFFRFWLWLTTGMKTKAWTAIHRKHHARCEKEDDPHSPQILGIKKVLFEGAELYKIESKNLDTLKKYGHGTPDDWIERNLYSKFDKFGISLMLFLQIILFGPIGVTIWAVQMLWIPVTAAGIINGIGHFIGYRNFEVEDASTNIFPLGIIIGGEELHNNHHAFASSAKLSSKWYEFDIGWFYIRLLSVLRLANIKKTAPKINLQINKSTCDLATLHSVIRHRYHLLENFSKYIKSTFLIETKNLKTNFICEKIINFRTFKKYLYLNKRDFQFLNSPDKDNFKAILNSSEVLRTIYEMKTELSSIWEKSSFSKEQLLGKLQLWCNKADESGIRCLEEFSRKLKFYI